VTGDDVTEPAGETEQVWPGEPAEPSELEPAGTGHPAVDAALQAVVAAADAPPADQVPAYQALHRTLRETLATIDQD
jgi:hypothetical protein